MNCLRLIVMGKSVKNDLKKVVFLFYTDSPDGVESTIGRRFASSSECLNRQSILDRVVSFIFLSNILWE